MAHSKTRIWEMDFLRGLAVVGMIIFHLYFALDYFGIKDSQLFQGWWLYFGNLVRFFFIGLVGVTLSLSSHKKYSKVLLHAANIFLLALLITLVTHLVVPGNTVRFGILHLISVGMVLALPFRKSKWGSLAIGIAIFLASFYLPDQSGQNFILTVIGMPPSKLTDLDYFPLIPWLSLIFFGLFLANSLKNRRLYQHINSPRILKPVNFLGRHSLSIYMIHIPIIVAILLSIFPRLWEKVF